MTQHAYQAAEFIQKTRPDFVPRLGILLSSGLDSLTEQLTDLTEIAYTALPGFPELSVKGHAGSLCLGYLNETPVVCLKGRSHTYETQSYLPIKTMIRTLKLLGCEYYIATNVSGSLREKIHPGELVLIQDHINFQPGNPLAGPNDDDFGPRFPPMDAAYNPKLNNAIRQSARDLHITLHEGIYISVLGPCYETAAEIRAFQQWGADVIGMSTVPEIIVANHCGLKTAVVSIITNYATGIAHTSHSHDAVVAMGKKAAAKVCSLLVNVAKKIPLKT